MKTAEERFWSKVEKTSDCWLWTGALTNGYGSCRINNKGLRAHRVSYAWAHGPIPEGAEVDHICHTKACVNPAHLRAITKKQNGENRLGATTASKSGVRGVYWSEAKQGWRALIRHNRRSVHVGYFATIQEADEAVTARRLELFTHSDMDKAA